MTIQQMHERLLVVEAILAGTGMGSADLQAPTTRETRLRHNLALHMKARGIRLSELSRKAGVAKQTVSDWQSGLVPRGIISLKKVADALGVTVDQLVFG